MSPFDRPILVGEDDSCARVARLVLDPEAEAPSRAAFADFFACDLPDFDGWCARVRGRVGGFYPATVLFARDEADLSAKAGGAHAFIVESLKVGKEHIDA